MRLHLILPVIALTSAILLAERPLQVHTLDVEGGKAVLIITPAGESMLIDVGWGKSATREASTNYLIESLRAAGLKRLDYLVISHYDPDHVGDAAALAASFPVKRLVDHGPLTTFGRNLERKYVAYAELFGRIPRLSVRAGDRIPIKGLDVQVVAAGGKLREGKGPPTPSCANVPQPSAIVEDAEDDASIGLLFTHGRFRMLDLADLEASLSWELACPLNRLGAVDVYHVNVHGQAKGMTPVLLDALRPRAAIMGNGARKGGEPATWPILRAAPDLEDIWQLHFSIAGGPERNPPPDFIANLDEACDHATIRLSAWRDGGFEIVNGRNGFRKRYSPRARK
jgi:competence protein ComEC